MEALLDKRRGKLWLDYIRFFSLQLIILSIFAASVGFMAYAFGEYVCSYKDALDALGIFVIGGLGVCLSGIGLGAIMQGVVLDLVEDNISAKKKYIRQALIFSVITIAVVVASTYTIELVALPMREEAIGIASATASIFGVRALIDWFCLF